MLELDVGGIYTHFATADEEDKTNTHKQARVFLDFLTLISRMGGVLPLRHAANSPAIVDLPEYCLDMVRPGLILTGFYTSQSMNRARVPVIPGIKLKARLVNIKSVREGEGVGYGHTYRTWRETLIGTIPLGFADGYPRRLSNLSQVLCKGKLCPVIGNICMDQMMVDVTEVPSPAIGDLVVLFGDGSDGAPTAEDAALMDGTIVDEVITRLSDRLPRVYTE